MSIKNTIAALCAVGFGMAASADWPNASTQEEAGSGWPTSSAQGTLGDSFMCSMFGELSFASRPMLNPPDPRIDRMVASIVEVTGLEKNFALYSSPDVGNAAATIMGEDRVVLYNPRFFDEMVRSTGTEWSVRSIMAHEIGHHLQGHTIQSGGSRPEIELQADKYSGAAVRWLGGSLQQAQAAMRALASETASRTHPGRRDRLAAIDDGWHHAGNSRGASGRVTVPRPQQTPQMPTSNVATACCGPTGLPMCAMLMRIPKGAQCACYILGQPWSQGISC